MSKKKGSWYSLQAKDTDAGRVAELRIYDEIGFWGCTAKDFVAELEAVAGSAVEVLVSVNSPGGDVFDAFAIYNALLRYAGKVTGRVDGVAASAASLVLTACDVVRMPANTMQMIHNAWTVAAGTAGELRKTADMMDKAGEGIISAYCKKSGQSRDDVVRMMDETTWMTAAEALELGFCDEIEEPVKLQASSRSVVLLSKHQGAPAELLASLDAEDSAPDPAPSDPLTPVQTSAQPNPLAPDPAPAPAPADLAPVAESADQLVAHIFSSCRASGLVNLAEGIVMSTKLKDRATVDAALKNAKDISDICAAAKLPELTVDYIKAGLQPEQVRARLFDKLTQTAAANIVNRQPAPDKSPKAKASGASATSIYANRRKAAGK